MNGDDEHEEEALPLFGGIDIGELLETAQSMQLQLMEKQANLASEVVEGQSGGGAVKVTVTGDFEFKSIKINRDAVDPDDVEMLEDLVLAAIHEAVGKAKELGREAFGGPMPGLPPLPGLPGFPS